MENQDADVTALVEFGAVDDEFLPLLKCVCGERFPAWDFVLETERADAVTCPECQRAFYFSNAISVFEVHV